MGYSLERDYDRFTVFDFETTGFGEGAFITEIGAVKVEHGEFIGKFSTLVNPRCHIPRRIQLLTGITDEDVRDAPTISQVLPDFLDFIEEDPIIAHNASFDCAFLYREARRLGRSVLNPVVDTVRLARKVWPGLPTYKLAYLTDYHGIAQDRAHRAGSDAVATAKLYLMMHT
jgi:DNA polymerase-3 subunit alpha (Gram-positive type)